MRLKVESQHIQWMNIPDIQEMMGLWQQTVTVDF